jgi:hypothetical protein
LKTSTGIISIDNAPISGEHGGMRGRGKAPSNSTVTILIFCIVLILSLHISQALALDREDPTAVFEQYVQYLYEAIGLEKRGLRLDVFRYALIGYFNLKRMGVIKKEDIISIIDFGKPCNDDRFYIIDLFGHRVLYRTLVAHGRNSGDVYARRFSNEPSSLKSSLGFFVTGDTYDGEFGYSLHLDGKDAGFNDQARSRGIVIHGAPYVGRSFIKQYGKIGRTQGCPALPAGPHIQIIDAIMGGTCLFQFYNDKNYLEKSALLDVGQAVAQFQEEYAPFIQIKVPAR